MIDERSRYADDTATTFLRQHLPDGKLSEADEAVDVGRRHLPEIFVGVVEEGLGYEDASVVNQRIDGAELIDRCFRNLRCCCGVADISIDESNAIRCLDLGGLAYAARCGDHVIAALHERVDECCADALGGSGD